MMKKCNYFKLEIHVVQIMTKITLALLGCNICSLLKKTKFSHQSGILRVELSDLYQLEVVLFMYDYVRTKLPLSFRNIFKFNCDVYDAYITRRAQMFHIPKTKSRFVDKLPLYNFPSMWNNWCTQLNVNSSRGALKNSMKTILINDYATLVKCENPRCIDCQLIT